MKDIGGYFELELNKGGNRYHDTPHAMKSGRSSLHYILNHITPSLVYIPYYTCDALLEPFKVANIKYSFYQINEQLEPTNLIELQPGEYFLYVNYLDVKRDTVSWLSKLYKDRLIVDATQAFFMKGNGVSWFFNSCRKFFGVPDGSYMYTPAGIQMPIVDTPNEEYITDHLIKRFNGHTNDGYTDFLKNEELTDSTISGMSNLTEYLLSGVDYNTAMTQRRENYAFLHKEFKEINRFDATEDNDSVPMCYPLLLDKKTEKSLLFDQHIFIPGFWKDVQERRVDGFEFEKSLADNLWPLPVDHRYSIQDMGTIADALTNVILK